MRFGISLPAFADFSDPHMLADLARDAEAAGWDGFFIWDAIFFDPTFAVVITYPPDQLKTPLSTGEFSFCLP
jgi:alkanesulfonate monooxygenase SsuD/methylene tetrahydromethanopterin reductase-like flavin-dependent oxidoreductase (luciferase family)